MDELMGTLANLHDLSFTSHHCFRRGPMYSAYAELREWKLKAKNKKLASSPSPSRSSIPPPSRRPNSSTPSRSVQDLSMAFRKENKRPPLSTPPPATPKHDTKRAMSEKKGTASGLFSMRKSYACVKELKDYSASASSAIDDVGRSWARGNNAGSARRQRTTATVSSSMSMSSMRW